MHPLLPIQSPIPFSGPPIPLLTLGPLLIIALLEVVGDMADLIEVVVVLILLVVMVLNDASFAIVATTLMQTASITLRSPTHTFPLHNQMSIFHIHRTQI